ncbi:MAG: FeoA family protein [Desulfurococcaceae archaeon]
MLSEVPQGKKAKVVALSAGGGLARRLYELGLLPGAVVEVVYNEGRGPIVISVDGAEVSLGRGIAKKVLVEPVD